MADKTLTSDQARLLTEVMTRTTPSLKPHDWNDVASKLGIGNGKAAKERFRYLLNSLAGSSSKTTNSRVAPATPRKPATVPSTPSRKRRTDIEEDTPAAKKVKSTPVTEEPKDEGQGNRGEVLTTALDVQVLSTTQGKQDCMGFGGEEEFSFFDHALYQHDQT